MYLPLHAVKESGFFKRVLCLEDQSWYSFLSVPEQSFGLAIYYSVVLSGNPQDYLACHGNSIEIAMLKNREKRVH